MVGPAERVGRSGASGTTQVVDAGVERPTPLRLAGKSMAGKDEDEASRRAVGMERNKGVEADREVEMVDGMVVAHSCDIVVGMACDDACCNNHPVAVVVVAVAAPSPCVV